MKTKLPRPTTLTSEVDQSADQTASPPASNPKADEPAPGTGIPAILLRVTDPPRPLPDSLDYSQPLVTLCWRVLNREREKIQESAQAKTGRLQRAIAEMARETYGLREIASALQTGDAAMSKNSHIQRLESIQRRIARILDECAIRVLAPVGQAYAGELVEIFDNIAQKPEAGLQEPRIAEVVSPAVLVENSLLLPGRAVIAVPAPPALAIPPTAQTSSGATAVASERKDSTAIKNNNRRKRTREQ